MDQSHNNQHFGAFNHAQFGVNAGAYGFDSAGDDAFHGSNVDGVDPAFFGNDSHTSALNDQGPNHFQAHSEFDSFLGTHAPYDQPAVHASQARIYGQHAAGAQQSGVGHFTFDETSPQPAQSSSHVASLGNTYQGHHAQSPALGHQLNNYQSLTGHQTNAGYQTAQLQSGYQPQTSYVPNQAHIGQSSGSSAFPHQMAFQPYQHISPSPSPYQPPQSPYSQQTGPSPVPQAVFKAPQLTGTPPLSQPQATTQGPPQSNASGRSAAQYQAQPVYQPTPTSQYQPPPEPQSTAQSHSSVLPQRAPLARSSYQSQAVPQPQPVTSNSLAPVNPAAQSTTMPAHPAEVSKTVQVPDSWILSTANDIPASETSTSSWEFEFGYFSLSTSSRTLAKQKYQQTVSLFARSDKKRLFPEHSFFLPSEALGKFMDNLEKLRDLTDAKKKDTRRKELYCTLRYDLKRGEHHMDPGDLGKVIDKECKHRKVEPADIGAKDKDDQSVKILEDVRKSASPEVDIETAALLDIHPFWGVDDTLAERMAEDLEDFIEKHVDILKAKAEYKELREGVKSNRTDPGSVSEHTMEKLRAVVRPLREKVGRILTVATSKADDRVLDKMERSSGSSLPQSLVPLWNLALICANTGDLNSPLVKAILDFTGRFPKLNDEALVRIKFPQLAPKIEAQGMDGVKPAIAKIRAIAAKNPSSKPSSVTAPKPENSKPTTKTRPTSSAAAAAGTTTAATSKATPKSAVSKDMAADSDVKNSGASSKKRPLEEGGESSASKKPATTTSRSEQRPTQPPAKVVYDLKPASRRAPPVIGGNRRPTTKPASDQGNTGATSSTPAMATETPKPRNTTTGQPISSSSEAAKPSRGSAATPAKATPKVETAQQPPSSSSGFSALFAEINAPKEEVKAARVPETVPDLEETEQDRERRLRKEKRRRLKLRVAFKADSQLTEVRIFHKEDGEDDGPEGNMTRDAADDKAEGKMLKASRRDQIALGREWEEPTLIDFSDIPEEQRAKSFVTRGGVLTFETEEQKKMAREEMTQLMVVYTDLGDIPPTPGSPRSVEPVSDAAQAPELPLPASVKWRTRPAERLIFGPVEQLNKAWNRKLGLEATPVVPPSVALSMIEKAEMARSQYEHLDANARAEVMLQILNSERAKNWVDPEPYNPTAPKTAHRTDYPDPQVQAAEDAMQGIVRSFQGKPAIPDQPPAWMQFNHPRVQEWWEGYYADQARKDHERQQQEAAARQQAEQHAALLAAQAAAVAQQNPYAAYYQNQPQNSYQASSAPQPPFPQPGLDPQVQALLAAMGQGQPQQQQTPDPNVLLQLAQWSAASQGQQPPQQAAQNQYGNAYGQDGGGYDQENRRDRDGGDRDRDGRRGGRGGRDGRKEDIPEHLRGINRSLIGTKKCMFWAKGQCAKGDKCTFRHE